MISSELGEGQMVEAGQEEEGSENESGREKNLRKGPETGSWDVLQFSFHGMAVKSSSGNSNWKGTQGKTLRNHCIVLSSNLIEFFAFKHDHSCCSFEDIFEWGMAAKQEEY